MLVVIAGSQRDDVPEHRVTRRLGVIAVACAMVETPWSVLLVGSEGVCAVAAVWAAEHGVECAPVEAPPGLFAAADRNRLAFDLMVRAFDSGWTARCEVFPTSTARAAWEMVRLCQGNGIPLTLNM